jgi:apolipoprotein N-acyltransferase
MKQALTLTSSAFGLGVLAALGRPGPDFGVLFIVAMFAFVVAAIRIEDRTSAACWFFCFSAPVMAFVDIGAYPWGIEVVLFLLGITIFGYLGALFILVRLSVRHLRGMALYVALASAWTLWMALLDELGFPLKCNLMALVRVMPAVAWGARLVGSDILSGVVMAGIVAAAVRWVQSAGATFRSRLGALALPFAATTSIVMVLSALAFGTAPPSARHLRVGVAQVDAGASYYRSRITAPQLRAAFDARVADITRRLEDTDILVFSEAFDGAYPWSLVHERRRWLTHAREHHQAILLTGYFPEASGRRSNIAVAIRPDGSFGGLHKKVLLAPHGESTLEPGTEFKPVSLREGVQAGVLICNETISGRGTRKLVEDGANVLIGTTSDSTFKSSTIPFEHIANTQLRAIETGRDLVWASNSGPSGVIDRLGRIRFDSSFRTPAAARVDVALYEGTTPYLAVGRGWWILALCALLGSIFVREARDSSPRRNSTFDRPRARGYASVVLTSGFVCAAVPFSLLAPIVTEWRQGQAGRALASAAELFASSPPVVQLSWAAVAERGFQVPLAYWWMFYGVPLGSAVAPPYSTVTHAGSLERLGKEIVERVGQPVTWVDVHRVQPEVPALVSLVDGSLGAVAFAPGGGVFIATSRGVDVVAAEHLEAILPLDARGLLLGTPAE